MGNRALIVTEEDHKLGNGISMYLHWNGGRDSVEYFLQYCKLRGFRSPERDDYGWARLAQVIANFMGADGLSVGVGYCNDIHSNDVGDNGTYIIKDWEIVGREFFSGTEQYVYDRREFLYELDAAQPERQQIGRSMIDSLLFRGITLDEAASMYHYSIEKRKDLRAVGYGFTVGSEYGTGYKGPITILERSENFVRAKYKNETMQLPKFNWKDGVESVILKDGHSSWIIDSTEVMG